MTRLAPSLLALAALNSSAAAAFEVRITSPIAGQPAFGEVTVAARVDSREPVAKVTLIVDGRWVREVAAPPYQIRVDLGQDNVEHSFQAIAVSAGGQTAEATLRTPRIKVDAEVSFDLQQLYVTVTSGPAPVLDLRQHDFQVLDGDKTQEIRAFARGDIPFTAIILLDASTSMRGRRLRAAIAGAKAFISAMKELDEAKLLVFSDRILHATAFSNLPEVLTAGLDDVGAGGGTALDDHLYLALKLLEERQGRRVIVLLSDGVDSHSALTIRDVLHKARQSQAIIYWVRLADESGGEEGLQRFSSWHDDDWYRQGLRSLREAVLESGGRIAAVANLDELVPAFQGIVKELRDQYVLGYYPTGQRHDGSWRAVEVQANRHGLSVLTRKGYLDY